MKLAKYVKFREEKFGAVLFETRSEQVYTLNAAAAAVVAEIGRGGGEKEIIERLQQQFNDSNNDIEHEAAAFIVDLKQRGLVADD